MRAFLLRSIGKKCVVKLYLVFTSDRDRYMKDFLPGMENFDGRVRRVFATSVEVG